MNTTISPKRKEALLDMYRYINVEYIDWAECVIDNFIEDMKELYGVSVDKDKVLWDVSYGHYDGATYAGRINDFTTADSEQMFNCRKFVAAVWPDIDELRREWMVTLLWLSESYPYRVSVPSRCRGETFSNNMHLDDELELKQYQHRGDDEDEDGGEGVRGTVEQFSPYYGNDLGIRERIWLQWFDSLDEDDINEDIITWYRGKADELYERLREEYDYLTSEEAVWESIVINELHVGHTDAEGNEIEEDVA